MKHIIAQAVITQRPRALDSENGYCHYRKLAQSYSLLLPEGKIGHCLFCSLALLFLADRDHFPA